MIQWRNRNPETMAGFCEAVIGNLRMLTRAENVVNCESFRVHCLFEFWKEDACERWSPEERVSWGRICATA